jgi:putative transposase
MIDRGGRLSVKRQCELLELNRTGVYYTPRPIPEGDLKLMRQVDELHLRWPFYGARRLARELAKRGFDVGRLHVATLMRRMGIEARYRKPRTSIPAREGSIYPYLLGGLCIERPNQVWSTDITYLPMAHGFLYLVAILDIFSRKVLAWRKRSRRGVLRGRASARDDAPVVVGSERTWRSRVREWCRGGGRGSSASRRADCRWRRTVDASD